MKTTIHAAAILLALASLPLRAATEKDQQDILKQVGFTQNLGQTIPLDLPFRDEKGQAVTLRKYFGSKPVLLNLVYFECPMLCTEVLNGIVRTLRAIPLKVDDDFNVVTVSFDPRETPKLAALKKSMYLDRYGHPDRGAGWPFLTGDQKSIKALADAVGFHFAYDPDLQQFAHASGIIILTPAGKVSHYFFGVEYPAQDVRLSLVEAGEGHTGSPVDQLLMYCYHYDPETGRYGIVVMRVLRLAALATFLALGSFVVIMLWKEKRPKAA
ncbi:MAG TPA: SCO family protein [Elusimicrobiota bacterium]|nr:SCO family protein [Elusimicrobiota bacterium]